CPRPHLSQLLRPAWLAGEVAFGDGSGRREKCSTTAGPPLRHPQGRAPVRPERRHAAAPGRRPRKGGRGGGLLPTLPRRPPALQIRSAEERTPERARVIARWPPCITPETAVAGVMITLRVEAPRWAVLGPGRSGVAAVA